MGLEAFLNWSVSVHISEKRDYACYIGISAFKKINIRYAIVEMGTAFFHVSSWVKCIAMEPSATVHAWMTYGR